MGFSGPKTFAENRIYSILLIVRKTVKIKQ